MHGINTNVLFDLNMLRKYTLLVDNGQLKKTLFRYCFEDDLKVNTLGDQDVIFFWSSLNIFLF